MWGWHDVRMSHSWLSGGAGVVALKLVISIGMEAVCREGVEAVGGWSVLNVMWEMEMARAREQAVSQWEAMVAADQGIVSS